MKMVEEEQKGSTWFAILFLVVFMLVVYVINYFSHNPLANDNRFWAIERASGFIGYELLCLTAILGVSMTNKMWDRLKLRKIVNQIHQHTALLVFPFVFLHLWGIYSDNKVPFGLSQILIPFQSTYSPVAVSLGILSLYILIVVSVSSYFRARIGNKMWRGIHTLSFVMFLSVSVHGFTAGTDSHALWAILLYAVPIGLFFILLYQKVKAKRT